MQCDDVERGIGSTKLPLSEPRGSGISTIASPPSPRKDGYNPPDGGFTAWTQVLAAHLINAMTWGSAATFGVYQLHYDQSLKLPSSQIAWIGSLQVFLTFAMSAFSGRLADAGYSRAAVISGTFLAIFGTFMTSLCTEYWQIILAQGVCVGLGLGICFMPAVAVASSYFDKNRALALATAASGTAVGSVVFPATIQYLEPNIGFPWAVRCSGFVAIVISVLAVLLLKPYLAPRKSGPLIEWEAFKELPYVFFICAAFLLFYALYFGFFYVSRHLLPLEKKNMRLTVA